MSPDAGPPVPAFVALLRAVNVGGTGKLPMPLLREACEAAGFTAVQTYLASGNAVFAFEGGAAEARRLLAAALQDRLPSPPAVLVRSDAALNRILADNPFAEAPGDRVMALVHDAGAVDPLAGSTGHRDEELRPGPGCCYVFYPEGAGRSRLRLPLAAQGTARNMRTLAALAAMVAAPIAG